MVLDSNQSQRKAVSNSDGRPVFHKQANKPIDSEAPALSHSTLHRWLGFIGAMTITLQIGAEGLLQADPNSAIHRFLGLVDPVQPAARALCVLTIPLGKRFESHFSAPSSQMKSFMRTVKRTFKSLPKSLITHPMARRPSRYRKTDLNTAANELLKLIVDQLKPKSSNCQTQPPQP